MRIAKEDIAVKVDASPGAVARQKTDFGDATEYGPIAAEHYQIAAGTDLSPLLQGLEDNLCQAPHWGYLIEGELIVSFKDGTEENPRSGDLFYWPPGHTIRAEKDTEMVLFSPQHEHTPVLDHLNRMLGGLSKVLGSCWVPCELGAWPRPIRAFASRTPTKRRNCCVIR